jgi:hypothetical protein
VEPKYEKQLQNLEELLNSDVVYGYHPFFSLFQDTFENPEVVNFFEQKKLQEDCSDIRKCVERMIAQRDLSSAIPQVLTAYIAREVGTVDLGKIFCSLDEDLFTLGVTILFRKGNPLLNRFNVLMRRYLKAGLLEKLYIEVYHRASLKGGSRLIEATGDMAFAFSLSHLMPAFTVLLVGNILSSMLLFAELILNCLCKRGKNSDPRRLFVSSLTIQM